MLGKCATIVHFTYISFLVNFCIKLFWISLYVCRTLVEGYHMF
jgi:hypothetical protein